MSESKLRIGLLAPEVLGTYGDSGNAVILAQRARWRGIGAEIVTLNLFDPIPTEVDVFTMGGGEDTAQALAAEYLRRDDGLAKAVAAAKPVLAICASLQVLGRTYTDAQGREVAGAGLLDVWTRPRGERAIGELVTSGLIDGVDEPLTGFENHGGATYLGSDAAPLGAVSAGVGNGDGGVDGVVQGSIVATYMHGPVLARNPRLADLLLERATGQSLEPLKLESVERLRLERIAASQVNPKLQS